MLKRENHEREDISGYIGFFEYTLVIYDRNPYVSAICRAGLVFDGQLVIDPEFRTNDPSIFAAGTMTKYRRRYYADSWQHKYYNSIEVGDRLASVLRSLIDNHQRNNVEPTDTLKNKKYLTLPMFRAPHIVACILPGGYRYLHIRKPGKMLLRSIAIRFDFYGKVLTTGSCTSEIGYFRIRLNRYDSVETITCFSKKDFEVYHMIALYGKHETMLNELKTRYQNSLISDLYAYFREPWAMAIFYDRFECLRVENRATLLSKTAIPGQSLNDDCVRTLIRSKWNAMSDSDRRSIEAKYAGSVYQQELEESLLDFLQFSEEDIPVYCTPRKLHQLYTNIENSPLYNDL
ncbi:cilia- and flagella-associated protein 61-like [Osmia bicornis bicornis]|uniref:cilia- and flagella-associated protein 61-like n=1 Tax=Osmia bicornis bicornis TaxID=1437191 RepID=UPI001EAF5D94|nr:cilia- and flagella-associated protein 61-like [Osmia bicornis bicornis]